MPELPEVERATRLLNEIGAGKKIVSVETTDDSLVYSGITHDLFAETITGRRMIFAHRYGKVFYLELEGNGKHPVLHFGMTGMLHVKGRLPIHYREAPPKASDQPWPPKWMKFILHFQDENGQLTEVAFRDARRLGRIRLCDTPRKEPPISELGFDPLLSMPPLDEFEASITRRKSAPIKALLLDQSFSAGIGNWVADEVLYHARIHPEQRCNSLTSEQLAVLHQKIVYVCKTATDPGINANDDLFPDDWLFKHRWNKGGKKKKKKTILYLPSGQPATIKWTTVGGRTSAFVVEIQKHPHEAEAAEVDVTSKRKRGSKLEDMQESTDMLSDSSPRKLVKRRTQTRMKTGKS